MKTTRRKLTPLLVLVAVTAAVIVAVVALGRAGWADALRLGGEGREHVEGVLLAGTRSGGAVEAHGLGGGMGRGSGLGGGLGRGGVHGPEWSWSELGSALLTIGLGFAAGLLVAAGLRRLQRRQRVRRAAGAA